MNLTVSAIPYGLRRDELLFEIINNLQKLEIIIETVFDSIDQKVVSFGPTLSDINVRTTNCAIKLSQLKTRGTRATKVFSAHKYPKNEFSDNKTVFKSVCNGIDGKLRIKDDYHSTDNDFNNNSKRFGQLIPFDDSVDDKMRFFRVNSVAKVSCSILYYLL